MVKTYVDSKNRGNFVFSTRNCSVLAGRRETLGVESIAYMSGGANSKIYAIVKIFFGKIVPRGEGRGHFL